MRQYAGMGTARETNARFRYLLDHGQTGLSVAFDLPTQMGLDSDHPRAEGEVGKTGVAIDSIDDMRRLFLDIPLQDVTTSMTINATAAILLLLYELVAEEQGVEASRIGGTVQNDLLKEYAARGTYIYPPKPSMRIITDRFDAKDPRSAMLRFHTQTGGATLTAQQPQNNIVRTALEAMAAVLGGTQSLHTNSFDEALALPTERAVKIALRTQQVIGYETGVANVADPLGGSYYVESLTDELESLAQETIDRIE